MVDSIKSKMNKISWKHWLLFLLLSQVIYSIMQMLTIPGIQKEAGGLPIFDMQFLGYSYEYAHKFLSQLTAKGYELYLFYQLPLDLLYPFLNFLTGICTFVLLSRIYLKYKDKMLQEKYYLIRNVLILPLASMVFDYLENSMIFVMLSYKEAVPKTFVTLSSIFTLLKSMSAVMFYTLCLITCVLIGFAWINNKTRRD